MIAKDILNLCEARENFYHGTSSVLAKKILKEGFVPDPKQKIWDSEKGSLESYYGTYLTKNLMTAISSAWKTKEKFGGDRVIFEVQVETRTGLFDEDELPHIEPYIANSLKLIINRYLANDIVENRNHYKKNIDDAVKMWISNLMRFMKLPYEVPIQRWDRLKPYAEELAWQSIFNIAMYDENSNKETPGFRKAKADLIKAIGGLAASRQNVEAVTNIRIAEPITFRGSNKIIAAILLKGIDDPTANRIVHLIPLYGSVSKDFIDQFKMRWGGNFKVGE